MAAGKDQLEAARDQIESIKKWNRLNAAFTYLPMPLEFEKVENELDAVIRFWKRRDPLDDLEIRALVEPEELSPRDRDRIREKWQCEIEDTRAFEKRCRQHGRKLKLYLNLIEKYCIAINCGVVDSKVAWAIYQHKFSRHYDKAKPYIDHMRALKGDNSILCEFETVVRKWKQNGPLEPQY